MGSLFRVLNIPGNAITRTKQITGSALFPGDICPELPVISGGTVTIFGVKRKIQEARKARNPDGTVNYTEVLLI